MSRSLPGFLQHVFDHPVSSPPWYQSGSAAVWTAAPAEDALLIAQCFEGAGTLLSNYSDEQVAQGLRYIVDPSCGSLLAGAFAYPIPEETESRLISSFVTLFDTCFSRRCASKLSSLDETTNALNLVCYMWWDVLPWYGRPNEPRFKQRDGAMLNAMVAILANPHDACREAALHGLGHWQRHYPKEVETAINDFVRKNPHVRLELLHYAQNALSGCVN